MSHVEKGDCSGLCRNTAQKDSSCVKWIAVQALKYPWKCSFFPTPWHLFFTIWGVPPRQPFSHNLPWKYSLFFASPPPHPPSTMEGNVPPPTFLSERFPTRESWRPGLGWAAQPPSLLHPWAKAWPQLFFWKVKGLVFLRMCANPASLVWTVQKDYEVTPLPLSNPIVQPTPVYLQLYGLFFPREPHTPSKIYV